MEQEKEYDLSKF